MLGLVGFLIFFLAWSLLSYMDAVPDFFLPTPFEVATSALDLFIEQGLVYDLLISCYRILAGFMLALIVAVPMGIFAGTVPKFEAFADPIVSFLRYIPPSAFVPLSVLWFGIDDMQKFSLLLLYVCPYIFFMVADEVAKVRKELIDAGKTLGANTRQIFVKIIIPHSLPGIWDAIHLMFGAAWTLIILVELISARSGLGHVLIQSQRFLQTSSVLVIIILLGLLGLAADRMFRFGYKRLFPWSEKGREKC